jgi:DNA-binding response OmpR family regulator
MTCVMSNRHILVCDDDELLVDLLTYRLGAKGYEVSAARDGGQALERLAADKPDAVVLDAMMPVIDGFEVLRRIREQPATANLPVVMLSARKQERDIVGALELGANDFVVKPFIPEELLARLARLLGEDGK